MNKKKIYTIVAALVLAVGGAGATWLAKSEKSNGLAGSVKHFAGKLISQAAPQASEIALRLPIVSPEELALTAQTYVRPQPHTPMPTQTLYFYSDGKAASAADSGGFYREIFGKTADGRLMVQDFYQDTKLPQTSVLILKNGSDGRNFTTGELDGRNIWFGKDGSLHSVADYANGAIQGAQVFYRDKQLVGAVMDKKMLVFHDDGKILAVVENDVDDQSVVKTTLFRADGSALVQSRMRGEEQVLSAAAWRNDGSQIRSRGDLEHAMQESLPLGKRADTVLRLMHE